MSARGRGSSRPARSGRPSLRTERALLREGFATLAGMDEVGRGSLAGPVTVGVVVVDAACSSAPPGVKDSKLLSADVRQALVPKIRRWARAFGVGHATAAEIDEAGIIAALRLAGRRALAATGAEVDLVVLDGSHDWLTSPDEVGLLAFAATGEPAPPVRTMVKADLRCSSVAAASVLAKVERDALMVQAAREHPGYGWEDNKGYAAPEHIQALAAHGPSALHRTSWRLPGVMVDDGGSTGVDQGGQDDSARTMRQ